MVNINERMQESLTIFRHQHFVKMASKLNKRGPISIFLFVKFSPRFKAKKTKNTRLKDGYKVQSTGGRQVDKHVMCLRCFSVLLASSFFLNSKIDALMILLSKPWPRKEDSQNSISTS